MALLYTSDDTIDHFRRNYSTPSAKLLDASDKTIQSLYFLELD